MFATAVVTVVWVTFLVAACVVLYICRAGDARREAEEKERRAIRRELLRRGEWRGR